MESLSPTRRSHEEELHSFLTTTTVVGCVEGDPLFTALSSAGRSMRLLIKMLRGPGKPPDGPSVRRSWISDKVRVLHRIGENTETLY